MASPFFTLAMAAAVLAAGTPAVLAQAGPHVLVVGKMTSRAFLYGRDPRQNVTYFTRKGAGRPPLVVYIHGGGWTAGDPGAGIGSKPDHFTTRGYAYATVGYRLVPNVTVEEQLDDVARAIAGMRYDAKGLGFDRDRVILIGHSSGGHLAAMLGTDPRYLRAARVPFEALRGVILLDSAGIDVQAIMAAMPPFPDAHYVPAFGLDPARQARLSPVNNAEAPNAPAWLMIYDRNNGYASIQSAQLAGALQASGTAAKVVGFADTSHMALNDMIGTANDAETAMIDAFLAEALGTPTPAFR